MISINITAAWNMSLDPCGACPSTRHRTLRVLAPLLKNVAPEQPLLSLRHIFYRDAPAVHEFPLVAEFHFGKLATRGLTRRCASPRAVLESVRRGEEGNEGKREREREREGNAGRPVRGRRDRCPWDARAFLVREAPETNGRRASTDHAFPREKKLRCTPCVCIVCAPLASPWPPPVVLGGPARAGVSFERLPRPRPLEVPRTSGDAEERRHSGSDKAPIVLR